jgi:molybdopterin-binding protein
VLSHGDDWLRWFKAAGDRHPSSCGAASGLSGCGCARLRFHWCRSAAPIQQPGPRPTTHHQILVHQVEEVFVLESARDVHGKISTIPTAARQPEAHHLRMRVRLDCGFPLLALITRQACAEMGLQPGETVTALVKAPAIHLIPRG